MTHQHGAAIVATITGLLALGIVLAAYGAYRLAHDLAAIADERRAWDLSTRCCDDEVVVPGPRMRANRGSADWIDDLYDDVIADTQPGSNTAQFAICEGIWKHSRKKGWKR